MEAFFIIDHDGAHPARIPGDPSWKYVANWTAFRRRDRKVFVQVVADAQAGITQFGKDYPQATARPDGTLPDDPSEWRILVGEPDDLEDEDPAHPAKVLQRLVSFKAKMARLDRESDAARQKEKEKQKEKAVKP